MLAKFSQVLPSSAELREATRSEKQLNFGFLLMGGGKGGSNPNPKLSRNFSTNVFSA